MKLIVTQVVARIDDGPGGLIIPAGQVKNEVDDNLVERAHDSGSGGATLHFQSGAVIEIAETFEWWVNRAGSKKSSKGSK